MLNKNHLLALTFTVLSSISAGSCTPQSGKEFIFYFLAFFTFFSLFFLPVWDIPKKRKAKR